MLGPMQRIATPMRRFPEGEEVDYVIVGVGAGGGVLLQRLARAGFRVVGFDAGPFWDTQRDWVSDEAGSHKLYWEDLRITGGEHPLALGANNSGKGVGGSTVHWASFTPRFHPSDFRVYTEDGVGADWPITYQDLKPYYEQLELEMPVAGPAYYPWGDPHGYPYGPHPMGGVGNILIKGCTALGIGVSAGGPVAILSGSRADRPHCIYRGFCIQGCKVGAKASTLITHVPDALASGAEIRDRSMVSRVNLGPDRRVTGVTYIDYEGKEHFQRARGDRLRVRHRDAPFAAELGVPGLRERLGELLRYGGPLPDGAGGQRDPGPLRRTGSAVQGPSRACPDRRVLRDRSQARFRAGLRHTNHRTAAHRVRQANDDGERRLGLGHAARHDGLQSLGRFRDAGRNPALER